MTIIIRCRNKGGLMSTFLVFLVVILVTTRLFGIIANKLHQPSVVGEMVAGIFLGPTILGRFYFPSITESFSNGDVINTFYYIKSNRTWFLYVSIRN